MMISEEQVRIALRFLQYDNTLCQNKGPCEVSAELIDRVRQTLDSMPECRQERVEAARARLAVAPPTSHEVAQMMIGRIISDSLR